MRVGTNPEKNKKIEDQYYHRIIVPVYIPHFDGYFKHSFDVLKLCLESILKTIHSRTVITIYNNSSHPEVVSYLEHLYTSHKSIDQLFHSKVNVGKINAILAAAKGNREALITVADADVLFLNGWQEAVEQIFVGFPEAGMVSPVPNPRLFKSYNANNWYYGIFKGKLAFETVQNPDAIEKFFESLNTNNKPLQIHLKKYLVLENNLKNTKGVMGCGHFVATLRREVFDKGPQSPATESLGPLSVQTYIDKANENLGFLRLATLNNYAFHMGNTSEDWMVECFQKLKINTSYPVYKIPKFDVSKKSRLGKILVSSLNFPFIKKLLFKKFGLKECIKDY